MILKTTVTISFSVCDRNDEMADAHDGYDSCHVASRWNHLFMFIRS